MEAETLAAAQEIDFSLVALFLRATTTVQVVMIILALASFWS
ncbi:MAG: Tol-Pal system subunit TolQ, partial [Pseudomonadota bacterium]